MSFLSSRPMADSLARLFATIVDPAPKRAVRFPEIAGETTTVWIPTRHGETADTIYRPTRSGHRPAIYVNVHGPDFYQASAHLSMAL
jgi:acetyl esterase